MRSGVDLGLYVQNKINLSKATGRKRPRIALMHYFTEQLLYII